MPCSIASRSCSREPISDGSRPKVARLRVRAISRATAHPTASAMAEYSTIAAICWFTAAGHPGLQDADRHLPDHRAGRVEDRRLAVGRTAEAAVVDADVVLAVQHRDRFLQPLADQRRVRVGEPHAAPVGDHHVGGAGAAARSAGQGRDDPVRVAGGQQRPSPAGSRPRRWPPTRARSSYCLSKVRWSAGRPAAPPMTTVASRIPRTAEQDPGRERPQSPHAPTAFGLPPSCISADSPHESTRGRRPESAR